MRMRRIRLPLALIALPIACASAACERAQLLAPTHSTITVTAATGVLPTGGSTTVSAFVSESSGTPVQNGTVVRFRTTLGRVDPVEAQTRNGIAETTFFAGDSSGNADVSASSGGATAPTGTGTGTGGTSGPTNTVRILVGAAAVNTITLRANPASVGPGGGTVEVIATVLGEGGRTLEGVPVTFRSDQGVLNPVTATTNSSGEARTQLTTSQAATVSATAGTKDASGLAVGVRTAPSVSIACAPTSGTGNCSAIQPSGASNSATVLFTVSRPSTSSSLRSARLDFGDGTLQELGTLAGGTATVTHTYSGPSGSSPATYVATVTATDINGEITSSSVTVSVIPRQPLAVGLSATVGTGVKDQGQPVTFTATVTPATGGADSVRAFKWDFGDGITATTSSNTTSHVYTKSGLYTATVTVETIDGREATGRAEFIISIPTI